MNKLKTGIRDAMIKKKPLQRNPTFADLKSSEDKLGLEPSKTMKTNKSETKIGEIEVSKTENLDLEEFKHQPQTKKRRNQPKTGENSKKGSKSP